MKFLSCILLASLVSGCAVRGKGILLSVDPATPLDERDLRSFCDLGDNAACALTASDSAGIPPPKFAIIQGVAAPDRAVFSALLPKGSDYSWFIYDRDLNRLWKLHDARKQLLPGIPWYVQKVEARGLLPGRNFELLAGDKDGNLIESRSFQTLSEEGELRIGIIKDLKDLPPKIAARRLNTVIASSPKLLLFTGSNFEPTFAKGKLPAKRSEALRFLSERNVVARNKLEFARMRKLIPVAATWSEAEYGFEGADRSFEFKDQAREVYEIFFPFWADEESLVNGPGVSKSIKIGGHSLALLDNRSFRIPTPCQPEIERSRLSRNCQDKNSSASEAVMKLGNMQIEWIYRIATKAKKNQVLWLISPEQWLGFLRTDSLKFSSGTEWLAQLKKAPENPRLPGSGCCAFFATKPGNVFEFSRTSENGSLVPVSTFNPSTLQ